MTPANKYNLSYLNIVFKELKDLYNLRISSYSLYENKLDSMIGSKPFKTLIKNINHLKFTELLQDLADYFVFEMDKNFNSDDFKAFEESFRSHFTINTTQNAGTL